MKNFLQFMSGKKTTIGAILALIITLALTKGWIDTDWAICLNGILIALGLTANVATTAMYKAKSKIKIHKK